MFLTLQSKGGGDYDAQMVVVARSNGTSIALNATVCRGWLGV